MKILAFIDKENKTEEIVLEKNGKVLDLLAALNINPVTVIVSKNGEIALEDDALSDGDSVKIHSVISGG